MTTSCSFWFRFSSAPPVAQSRAEYSLTPQKSYDLLEIIEARCKHGSIIFCTQYETEGWYKRINPDPDNDSPISEAIMDRIIHNAFDVLVDGKISMRERHGLKNLDLD